MTDTFNYSSLSCFTHRPSEKIRYLVVRNLQKLIKLSIKQAMQFSNTSTTKTKAIKQLKYTILLGQSSITPHTEQLLKSMVRISHLDLQHIEKMVYEIVQIIGLHVKSSYYIPLMINILNQEQIKNNTKNTIVFFNLISHILKNSREQEVKEYLKQIAKVLGHYEMVFYDNDEGLVAIFHIVETIIQKIQKFQQSTIVSVLFSIVLNVQATKSISQQQRKKTQPLMSLLAKKSGYQNIAELHSNQIDPILNKIIKNKQYVNWNKTTKDRFKFDTIVRNCHSEMIKFLPEIMQILEFMINPQSDLQVRMDTLVLIEFLLKLQPIHESLKPIAQQLFKKILLPSIQWKVGKPQIKIRKAGMINMILSIENDIISDEQLIECYKDLVPHLKNCLNDDWAPELRLASCEFFEKYLLKTREIIDTEQLRELYPMLLQRLDDSQDPIRKKITIAINVFFSCRYVKLTESTFQYMVNAIFIHFDDNSEEIQDAIYVSLRYAANIDPGQVLKSAKQQVKKMKHTQKCKELIQFCEELIDERSKS